MQGIRYAGERLLSRPGTEIDAAVAHHVARGGRRERLAGFIVAVLTQLAVLPWFDVRLSVAENLVLAGISRSCRSYEATV